MPASTPFTRRCCLSCLLFVVTLLAFPPAVAWPILGCNRSDQKGVKHVCEKGLLCFVRFRQSLLSISCPADGTIMFGSRGTKRAVCKRFY